MVGKKNPFVSVHEIVKFRAQLHVPYWYLISQVLIFVILERQYFAEFLKSAVEQKKQELRLTTDYKLYSILAIVVANGSLR